MPTDLRLLSFPSADAAFREDVERAAETVTERMTDQEGRAHVASGLRPHYRSVEVVAQDHLAQNELQPIRVWYVYRDGRVRPASERRERFYAALASARKTCDASRVAMADARAAARAAGYPETLDVAVGGFDSVEAPRPQSTRRTVSSV